MEDLIGKGVYQFEEKTGVTDAPINVYYFRPTTWNPGDDIAFVMHGTNRDAERYLEDWTTYANEKNILVVCPEFSNEKYPGSRYYNTGNIMSSTNGNGKLQNKEDWVFPAINRIVDNLKTKFDSFNSKTLLYGHSAGAQIVHRYAIFDDSNNFDLIIPANAGWYTMPDDTITFPYGVGGVPISNEEWRTIFSKPLVVLLGENDTVRDSNLRVTTEADAQGENRLKRGKTFYEKMSNKAKKLGFEFNWKLSTVPDVGHSDYRMAKSAVEVFLSTDQTILTLNDSIKSPVTVSSAIKIINASKRTTAVKITGNSLANTISGGSKNDTIYGEAGNDSILGNAGNDYLNGDAGNDYLNGGNGHDILLGGANNDTLYGGNGNDSLSGGKGIDKIYGGKGKDSVLGNEGNDILYGGADNDTIWGNEDNDKLYGETGNDYLDGGNGNDTLSGGADNDTLYGGNGNDSLSGGEGIDKIYGGKGKDSVLGNEGNDIIYGGADNDTIWGNEDNDKLYGETGNDYLDGGNGNDTLSGGANNDTLYGGNGNDSLSGGEGIDKIYGGKGKDSVLGNEGNDIIYGGADNDTIWGNEDNDKLYGETGNDKLYGGAGNDSLWGGKGNDSLWGDDGKDTFLYADGDDNDVIYNFANDDMLKITGEFTTNYNSSKKEVYINVGSTANAITLKDFSATTFNVNGTNYKLGSSSLVKK